MERMVAMLVGLVMFVINVFTIVIAFENKLSRPKMVAIFAVCLLPALGLVQLLNWWLGPYSPGMSAAMLVFFIPFYFFTKGSPAGKIFLYVSQVTVPYFLALAASFTVQLFTVYGSRTYYITYIAGTFLLFAMYALFIGRFGKRYFDTLFSYTGGAVWWLYAALPLAAFVAMRVLYFRSPGMVPMSLQKDAYFLLLPVF